MSQWRRWSLVLGVLVGLAGVARADDWPQWLGPRRDGIWRETGILRKLPPGGPTIKWRVPIGSGYAGPAVWNGRLYVMDRQLPAGQTRNIDPWGRYGQDGLERVLCLDAATGKTLWIDQYPARYTISYAAGPRTTPAIDEGRVYTFGAEGHLRCLDALTGRVIWARLALDGEAPVWGCASHPLIDGDRLFINTGSTTNTLRAFDKHTGKVLWQSLSCKEPCYCPPVLVDRGGTRQLIQWTPESVNSLNPATGQIYWSIPFGPVRYGTCIWQPVLHDDYLFVSSEQNGAMLMELDRQKPAAKKVWMRGGRPGSRRTDALHNLMSTVIIKDDHLYGVGKAAEFRCLDLKTGDRIWQTFQPTSGEAGETRYPGAWFIPNGDRTFIVNDSGYLLIAQIDPAGYHEISRAKILEPTNSDPGRLVVWSHPAFAGRRMYWRNDRELVCVDLAATSE